MKKFACLALAAVMALGTAFAFTGCNSGNNGGNNNGGTQSGTEGGNQGGNQGGSQGGTQGGNQGENVPSLDGVTQEGLFDSIFETEFKYAQLDIGVEGINYSMDGLAYVEGGSLDYKAYAGLNGETDFDLLMSQNSDNEEAGYDISFIRGQYNYEGYGAWKALGLKEKEYDKLLEAYKTNDALSLRRYTNGSSHNEAESDGEYGGSNSAAESKAAEPEVTEQPSLEEMIPVELVTKLLGNLAALVGAPELKAVSGGYELSFDLLSSLDVLVANVAAYLATVKADSKLGALLKDNDSFLVKTVKGLLKGVKASEIIELLPMLPLPSEMLAALPEAGTADAYDYIVALAADEDFAAQAGISEMVEGVTKFEDLTVQDVINLVLMISGSEPSEEGPDYLALVNTFAAAFKKDLVGSIANIFLFGPSALLTPDAERSYPITSSKMGDATVALQFNADKTFKGIALDVEKFTVATPAGTDADDVTSIEAQGTATITLLDSSPFTDLKGMRYYDVSDGPYTYDNTRLAPDANYRTSYMSIKLENDTWVQANLGYTLSWEVTTSSCKATFEVPELNLKETKEFTLAQLKAEAAKEDNRMPFGNASYEVSAQGKKVNVSFDFNISEYSDEGFSLSFVAWWTPNGANYRTSFTNSVYVEYVINSTVIA